MDAVQFFKDFPEFAPSDPSQSGKFDAYVAFWMNVATLAVNPNRWRSFTDLGIELFTAHNIVLEATAQEEVNLGGVPGLSKGVIAGNAAHDLSVAYDTASVLEPNAGHWNYTVYGKRFIRFSNMAGMGPIQLGGTLPPPFSGGAWSGPPPWPGWFVS